MKILGTIEGVPIKLREDGVVEFTANACIDCDGSDNRHNDPCWQAETSLFYKGKPIDSESVPYVVVPPFIIKSVAGVILGCHAKITNIRNGKTSTAVVADVGPRRKIGELSCEAARRVGLSGNPNHGGTHENIIKYELFPGQAALVDGTTYKLKPSA